MDDLQLIKSLEVRIDDNSRIPRVILNGVDFQDEKIGLKSLRLNWKTMEDEMPETIMQIDYMHKDTQGRFREMSIVQSFPNTLLGE